MKLKVYSEEVAKNADEGQLFLRLVETPHQDILIQVVSKNGESIDNGILIIFELDKKFLITPQIEIEVANKIGLRTDINDQLLICHMKDIMEMKKQQFGSFMMDRLMIQNEDKECSESSKH